MEQTSRIIRKNKRIVIEGGSETMQKENLKNYLFITGMILLVIGILLFAVLSSPVQYIGIIFLIFAIVLFASSSYLKYRNSDDGRFRSRTRDQILKHQFRK